MSDFPAWGPNKETGNPQGMWPWRPAEFDYRTSRGLGERETSILEGTNKTQRRGAVIPQETEPKLSANVGGSPVEAWASRASPQGLGHWKVPFGITLPWSCRLQGWVASGQTTIREGAQPTHHQIIGLKLYWARPCSPEQDPVFPIASPSYQEAFTSLFASSIREEARRSTVSQWIKQKPYHKKVIVMKKQKIMSQMKGQDKTPGKQLN